MPSYIVKQPNGLFARFSTVVDDFTHLNYSYQDMVQLCKDEYGRDVGHEKVARGDREEACAVSRDDVGQPLHRWNSCIDHMRSLGDNWKVQVDKALRAGNTAKDCPMCEAGLPTREVKMVACDGGYVLVNAKRA